jgi:hypothetical protein
MAVTRQKVGIDYFTDIMPYFERAPQLLRVGFAFILKDIFEPINEFRSNWYPYRGGYTSLFVFLLMMTGAIWRWRQTWGWSLWVIIAVALSFSRTVFAFGYEQLHLPQLSLAVLFFGSGQQIPEMILAVYGMHVIISEAATKSAKVVIRMVIVGVQLILGACAISLIHERNFVWTFMGRYEYIVYEVAVVGLLLLIALTTSLRAKWAITFGIIFLNTVVLLQPLLVTQRLDEIGTRCNQVSAW